jgi:hypothetical protein
LKAHEDRIALDRRPKTLRDVHIGTIRQRPGRFLRRDENRGRGPAPRFFKSIPGLLLERRARRQFSRDEDLVFGSIVGSPVDPGNFVRGEFKKAQRKAGLGEWVTDEESGKRSWVGAFRWHDLRH